MAKALKSKVWEVQSHTHDLYGMPIFTGDMIEKYIQSKGTSLLRWAWVIHDKDVYTLEEERRSAERNNGVPTVRQGEKKPPHIHLDLEFANQVYNTSIAKDFNLPPSQVQLPEAKYNKFMALVTYLTHEKEDQQALGKHRYDDSEIHANFNFRYEIDNYLKTSARAKVKRNKKANADALVESLECGETTIDEIKKTYGFAFFLDYEQKFLKARQEYLKKHYQMLPRINYYIDGPSGRGKTTLAEMLARSIVPELSEDEAYYEVGNAGVRFDNYEHQPIIIWDDIRAVDLITEYGREGVLNLLEVHPKKRNYHIKYGGVILTNQVNIFTGKDSYEKFLDGLAGEYKDKAGNQHASELYAKEQTYRRVPIIIHLHPSDIEVLLNRGVFEGTNEYLEYQMWAQMKANILSVNVHYSSAVKSEIGKKLLAPVVDKHNEYMLSQGDWDKVDDLDAIPDFEIAVGYEACKEMEKRDRADYEIFKQRWKEVNAKRFDKERQGSNARYSVDELAEQRVMTYEQWFEQGRPMSPGEGYVDTYAGIAEAALERKYDKWLDEASEQAEQRDMEEIERLLSDEEDASMAQVDYHVYVMELNQACDVFEKNPSRDNFNRCLEKLSENFMVVAKEQVVQRIADIAVANKYISNADDMTAYVMQYDK